MMDRKQKTEVRGQRSEVRSHLSSVICLLSSVICLLSSAICLSQDTSEYVHKAWSLKGKKDFPGVYSVTEECISVFGVQAGQIASALSDFPNEGEEGKFKNMNDVATCYFIKAEALREEGRTAEAIGTFQIIVDTYPYSQAFDPKGWYWSIKEKAVMAITQLQGRTVKPVEPPDVIEKEIKFILNDSGTEFPVNYSKYGEFLNIGTKDYQYKIKDPIGLSKACGEGISPNSNSVKFNPQFIKIKKSLSQIDHWNVLNSRDLRTAFYKWNISPEPAGVKLFYIADILERSGHLKHAIKAYYAILVHYPNSYGWTYWHTPWYIGKAALYRLQHLLRENPKLGLKLEDASIEIINGYDNEIRNDIFIVSPGQLTKMSLIERLMLLKNSGVQKHQNYGRIVQTKGGERVKLVKYENGHWQMLVHNAPFIIQGITYDPTRIGESPDDGTMENWTTQDVNNNGIIDAPYETWVDKNMNNIQDIDEKAEGDFKLMKEMGVNTLRLYHQPFERNKELIGQMYQKYGIYIIIGDFLGKYTLGSAADWEKGTDYDNPVDRANMLDSVKKMVETFKNEPYVLMWLLGNENVYGLGCNADKKPQSFFKFANEAAQLIKSLDPQKRPVAIASGDSLFLNIFAQNCPDIDVFGTNVYRGKYGFLDLWDEVKRTADIPAMITEYGAPSYAKGYTADEAQNFQAEYHKANWKNIYYNSCGYGAGNAIGGFAFEWLDEWWKAYEPAYHDKKGLFAGPFLDGYMHEEWLGLCGQGKGEKSPYLRQLKKAYFTYKKLWANN